MSETVKLPALGESVSEATITRWLKQVGSEVAVGDPLVEVATDKVDTEVLSEVEGVVTEILVPEGTTVDVGVIIALINSHPNNVPTEHGPDRHEEREAATSRSPRSQEFGRALAPQVGEVHKAEWEGDWTSATLDPLTATMIPATIPILRSVFDDPRPRTGSPFQTLYVRKKARENGLELSLIGGTGLNGRIRKSDLETVLRDFAAGSTSIAAVSSVSVEIDIPRNLDHEALDSLIRSSAKNAFATWQTDASKGHEDLISTDHPTVLAIYVAADDGYHFATPHLGITQVAALSVGAPRLVPRVASIAGTDAIIIGRAITVTLTVDPEVISADSATRHLATFRDVLTRPGVSS